MIKPRRLPRIGENSNSRKINSINNNSIPAPNNLFQ